MDGRLCGGAEGGGQRVESTWPLVYTWLWKAIGQHLVFMARTNALLHKTRSWLYLSDPQLYRESTLKYTTKRYSTKRVRNVYLGN